MNSWFDTLALFVILALTTAWVAHDGRLARQFILGSRPHRNRPSRSRRALHQPENPVTPRSVRLRAATSSPLADAKAAEARAHMGRWTTWAERYPE